MTLDDVPADVTMELTAELDRLFKTAGCRPTCHVCFHKLALGDTFSLVALNGMDQMVCARARCGRKGLEQKAEREAKEKKDREDTDKAARVAWNKKYPNVGNRPAYGGGYSRPSRAAL